MQSVFDAYCETVACRECRVSKELRNGGGQADNFTSSRVIGLKSGQNKEVTERQWWDDELQVSFERRE